MTTTMTPSGGYTQVTGLGRKNLVLHPVPFIRNTVILEIVLFLNFGRNLSSPVAYLFLNF